MSTNNCVYNNNMVKCFHSRNPPEQALYLVMTFELPLPPSLLTLSLVLIKLCKLVLLSFAYSITSTTRSIGS
uniref:Uncharacterized protein n=1 Tax=Picea glauca TaxID=3330 RepID=A0A101LVG9_PICGL|nr:hypothetical protein ABT39_MTgene1896 [Picea glauca]QHR92537.1 hypothetical protein Q903MT_gene6583 [Picea sitchensis]